MKLILMGTTSLLAITCHQEAQQVVAVRNSAAYNMNKAKFRKMTYNNIFGSSPLRRA